MHLAHAQSGAKIKNRCAEQKNRSGELFVFIGENLAWKWRESGKMIAFLSPAKNIRACEQPHFAATRPAQTPKSSVLLEVMREYSPWQLESLLKINPEIAMRAFADYQALSLSAQGSPALLAYQGLAYWNMNPLDFTPREWEFAAEHLRIISSFYGLLRPTDGICSYRLELGCKLRVDGKSLYAFWGDSIHRALFAAGRPVINLASAEFAKAVIPWLRPWDNLITCVFMTAKKGKLTTLATDAKMARGQMARFIVKNHVENPEDLKAFGWQGYRFSAHRSDERRYVFIHEGQP